MKRLGAIATRKSTIRSSLLPISSEARGRLECFAHSVAARLGRSAENQPRLGSTNNSASGTSTVKATASQSTMSNRSTIRTLMRLARSNEAGISDVEVMAVSLDYGWRLRLAVGERHSDHGAGLTGMLDAAIQDGDITGLQAGREKPDQ